MLSRYADAGAVPGMFAPSWRDLRRLPVAVDSRQVQAELVQLDKNLSAAERRNRAEPTDVKRAFYAEILGFAQERGKSEGWAAHKYRARYGVWPNAHKGTPPARAGAEVRKFIQAENIRYARRREQ